MERIIIRVLMALAGAAAGYMLPAAADNISDYKCRQKGLSPEKKPSYIAFPLTVSVTVSNAGLWFLSALGTDHILQGLSMSFLFSLAILISLIDLRIRIIPNELVLAMCAAGAFYKLTLYGIGSIPPSLLMALGMMTLFSAAAGFAGFNKVGAGDVKLAGAMGFSLGYPSVLTALAAMSAALLIYSLGGLASKKLSLKSSFPFAPFMMLGLAAALIGTAYAG